MDICFQLFAEVKDVDELLEMVRSTALTDYIRFDLNGDGDTDDEIDGQPETQPLQLMNPAGFILKYLMPTVPTSIKLGETINLGKGYYHGIIFDIPGAEVKINGEWIAFTENNKATILAQNPSPSNGGSTLTLPTSANSATNLATLSRAKSSSSTTNTTPLTLPKKSLYR